MVSEVKPKSRSTKVHTRAESRTRARKAGSALALERLQAHGHAGHAPLPPQLAVHACPSRDELAAGRQPHTLGQQVLRTDVAGMPLEWIDYKEAVRLYHMDQVAYACGSLLYRLRGGTNAKSGLRTVVEVSSIIATTGHSHNPGTLRADYVPPLNNETLFKRDGYLCMYCGGRFVTQQLSRDHIRPFCRGGQDVWTNVVTACRRCNNAKAYKTPEEAGMQLLAVPFTPTYAEYIYLKGRRVLADQMEYLLAHFPRTSPLHARIREWLQ
jgi:5-methylcytosine-specific restriction endonuclease McrA